jgi:hypothetical protein
MKYIFLFISCLLLSCISNMKDVVIEDYGVQCIGDNIYIKKLVLSSSDRVYILVDSEGKLISGQVSTNITIRSGKSSSTRSSAVLIK